MKNSSTSLKEGSIVFLLVMFMMMIVPIMYASLRFNGYFVSLMRERERHELHYQLTWSIHNYALKKCQNLINNGFNPKNQAFSISHEFSDTIAGYKVLSGVHEEKKGKNNVLVIITQLLYQKKAVFSLITDYKVL